MNSTNRFSDRVENYFKHRPGYPDTIIPYLKKNFQIRNNSLIADIGSGTGISSELFLKQGFNVIGIEPNKEMREAAEKLLSKYDGFTSVNASAEQTGLDDNFADMIVAGQAFHWFDLEKCKAEFKRILKPDGIVCLMWNERLIDSNEFLREYEKLILQYGTDYEKVKHTRLGSEDEEAIDEFFAPEKFEVYSVPNYQYLDYEGFKGRLLSSSYIPQSGDRFESMMGEMKLLFDKYQKDGKVVLEYVTRVYTGRM